LIEKTRRKRLRQIFLMVKKFLIIFSLPFLDRYFLQQRTIFVDFKSYYESLYMPMPNVKDRQGLWEDKSALKV
jgi:hypothetical protein